MAAHSREFEHVLVWQVLGLSLEAERVSHTVTTEMRRIAALLRSVNRRRDVDAQPEVRLADRFHEVFGRGPVVEYGRRRGCGVESGDHRLEIRRHVRLP